MLPRRIPTVRQHDITDCGAACLRSVAAHHGLALPISRIRQLAGTDARGTSVLGLVEAATRMGFTAKGVRASPESLPSIPVPAIAHVVVEGALQHYVVIYEVTPGQVVIMDPADGRVHRRERAHFAAQWTGVLLLLVPGERFRPGGDRAPAISRFWSLLRPHRGVLTQALVGAAAYTLLGLATAVYVQKIVDHVIVDGNRNLLNLLSVIMVALLLVQAYIGAQKSLLSLRTGQRIDARLILGYYQHLLRLPQPFFDTMRVGEIISRVNDAVKIRAFINDVSLELVVNGLVVVFSLALMFVYSPGLALLMLAVVPVYLLIYLATNRVNRSAQRRLMESAAELETQLVESLNAVTTIRRFGLEWYADLKTEARFVRLLRSVYRSGTISILSGTTTHLASRLCTVALLWAGAGMVMQSRLSPGELMSLYTLLGYFTAPAAALIAANRTVQDALIAADRLFEIMDLEREQAGTGRVELTRERAGEVRFERVGFRYGTRTRVFEELSLTLPAGRITAVVGESGSGKSTLTALMQGLYAVDQGRILIGELDLRHIELSSLRRQVAAVPQRIDLFAGTVVDNIAVGVFEPDMGRLLDICGRLGITDFVQALPQGFQTQIGENGATLSGGQRQRLAIARALYADPRILILDEATSSLDPVSERFVQRTLHQLREAGMTVVLIAHRLSTVMRADRIVVLDAGRVVEQGSHEELMQREGAYFRLWQDQMPEGLSAIGYQLSVRSSEAGAPS